MAENRKNAPTTSTSINPLKLILTDLPIALNIRRSIQTKPRLQINTLALSVGLKYAFSGRSFISFISLLAIGGLVLSVAVLVLVLSVINGFERELKTRILGVLPHVTLHARKAVDNGFSISSMPATTVTHTDFSFENALIEGASVYVQGAALLASESRKSGGMLTGIDPQSFPNVSELAKYMVEGSLSDLKAGQFGIVVGSQTAEKLNLKVGSSVSIILPEATVTPVGLYPRQKRFTVVGVFETHSQLDSRGVYVHVADASRLFRLGTQVHGVYLKLTDVFAASAVSSAILTQLDSRQFYVSTWMRSYGNLYHAIKIQKTTMFVLLSFLVTVAAFNLVSTLVMVVNERRADVAVFRTLGGNTRMIISTFVVLGSVIGAIGVVLGIAVGSLLSWILQDGYMWLEAVYQLNLLNQYFVTYLPVELRVEDLLTIMTVSLVLCMLSTLYPAWRASRLQPGDILSHE